LHRGLTGVRREGSSLHHRCRIDDLPGVRRGSPSHYIDAALMGCQVFFGKGVRYATCRTDGLPGVIRGRSSRVSQFHSGSLEDSHLKGCCPMSTMIRWLLRGCGGTDYPYLRSSLMEIRIGGVSASSPSAVVPWPFSLSPKSVTFWICSAPSTPSFSASRAVSATSSSTC
jgi:hypothetical protein